MSIYLKKLLLNRNNNIIIQFFRYAIVGGLAAIVDVSVFSILAQGLELNHFFSNTISFVFGLLSNYFLSRTWVFNSKDQQFAKDFTLFTIIGVIGLLLSNFILLILIDFRILYKILDFISDDKILLSAKLIAVFLVLFWNFIARKKFVFNRTKEETYHKKGSI